MEPYRWLNDGERDSPPNLKLMEAIGHIENALGLKDGANSGNDIALEDGLREMEKLVASIERGTQDPHLIVHAEGQVAKCIGNLVDRKRVPAAGDRSGTDRFRNLLALIAKSEGPGLRESTEANFEDNASWGSPAPRVDAARAALELALRRPDLYPDLQPAIDGLLRDPHPAARLEAILHLVRIWDIDRAGFWRRLSGRLAVERNTGVLEHACAGALERVIHADPERAERIALDLLRRFESGPERHSRMRRHLSGLVAVLSVRDRRRHSQKALESWIADAAAHRSELSSALHTLRTGFVDGLAETSGPDSGDLRHRAQAVAAWIVTAANAGLEEHLRPGQPSAESEETIRGYFRLLDAVCMNLYFAAKPVREGGGHEGASGDRGLAVFFEEIRDTLEAIGNFATPHTVHYLLQLIELLVPVNPAGAFDLVTHAIRSGGQRTGYQFESMGSDLFVRLVGRFLADHNGLFGNEGRRNALIDCLDIFMDAGSVAAQRLLYRLPELIE